MKSRDNYHQFLQTTADQYIQSQNHQIIIQLRRKNTTTTKRQIDKTRINKTPCHPNKSRLNHQLTKASTHLNTTQSPIH